MVRPETSFTTDDDALAMRAYSYAIWRPGADRGVLAQEFFASDEAALAHASQLLAAGDVLFVVVTREGAAGTEYLGQWSWAEPQRLSRSGA